MRAVWVLLVAAALTTISCGPPPGEEIPFETVLLTAGGDSRAYFEREPKVVVATDADELDELKALLSPNDRDVLQNIDLSTYLVIAAFQGWQHSGGYKIEIVSVRQSWNQVYVVANLVTLSPGTPATQEVTSPSHVVKVKKTDLAHRGKLTFTLMNLSGRAVARTVPVVQ